MTTKRLIVLTHLLCAAPALAGGVVFVDDDAPDKGDGQSWDTAYRFLQNALVFASDPANGVTEIRVGQGVYQPDRDEANPDGTGDREATFQLANGVALMGGYAGIGAEDPEARDVNLYETALSGDLLGDDGDDFANAEENSINVITISNANSATVMDGFVIRGGFAQAGASLDGGGILIVAAAPRIRYCTFESNAAEDDGGAIFAEFADLLFESCDFIGNQCNSSGGAMVGAKQAAALIGISERCWRRHRSAGECPQPIKYGGRILWRVAELRAWTDAGGLPR